jgi:trehalose 6-phosphate synthase
MQRFYRDFHGNFPSFRDSLTRRASPILNLKAQSSALCNKRFIQGESMTWNQHNLQEFAASCLGSRKLIVVSHREPFTHVEESGSIRCCSPAGGLSSALDPIVRACRGTWVAAAGNTLTDAPASEVSVRLHAPPGPGDYILRRICLPAETQRGYYYGLANGALWPLCHAAFQRPQFHLQDWRHYQMANEAFAQAVLEEAGCEPAFVFVQDYHLALLPRLLKQRRPDLTVAHFWHIPWPNRDVFRIFPWKHELLRGLLSNDLLGFQLPSDSQNFLDCASSLPDVIIERETSSIHCAGHQTLVRFFPISIDFQRQVELASTPNVAAAWASWNREFESIPELLAIGVDRMDYTKGIPERLAALERLFETHPEYMGRLTLLQLAVPCRSSISAYETLSNSLRTHVQGMNQRWSRGCWKPVVLVTRLADRAELAALYLMADLCLVTSLHDGMNLVAKEFVASRVDGDGVLILSSFAGAARELQDALLVNPFCVDELAAAMHRGLCMPAVERRRRMNQCRAAVSSNNVFRWAAEIFASLATHSQPVQPLWHRIPQRVDPLMAGAGPA